MAEKTQKKAISKLGVGPLSEEIIEAAFRFSFENKTSLMLIASKNQIDWDGGYVNNWNTEEYIKFVGSMRQKYPDAKTYICRDHCGPGFNGNFDLEDVYHTIEDDVKHNFDLIHVDFCHYKGRYKQILSESRRIIEYIIKLNPQILIEIGTEENSDGKIMDLKKAKKELDFFAGFFKPYFYARKTGSLIKEVRQYGSFKKEYVIKLKKIADEYGIFIKEHNGDYLTAEEIKLRRGIVGALNVAPQYGVIQTKLTLQKCATYGIDYSSFLEISYKSNKWRKWLNKKNNLNDKYLCAIIAGHYNFTSSAYKKIYRQIQAHENFRESIILEIMRNIKIYIDNL